VRFLYASKASMTGRKVEEEEVVGREYDMKGRAGSCSYEKVIGRWHVIDRAEGSSSQVS
jgi:hypothetical protein